MSKHDSSFIHLRTPRAAQASLCLMVVSSLCFQLACAGQGDLGEFRDELETEADLAGEEAAAEAAAAHITEPPFDPQRAMEIARSKLGGEEFAATTIDVEKAAACGTSGATDRQLRQNDAARQGAANQRSGSSTGCPAVGVLQPTDDALYFCFTHGQSFPGGDTWTYNENLRTGVRGWTRDDLLEGFGSPFLCPP